ncbi:MAG: hypothetical protein ACI91O_001049 [Candidatus Poriferisodalaceae bacterium]|jgi:hypothetical protein
MSLERLAALQQWGLVLERRAEAEFASRNVEHAELKAQVLARRERRRGSCCKR